MADVNEVIISGVVHSEPTLTKLSSSTPVVSFQLVVMENYTSRAGQEGAKENIITIEVLGKKADEITNNVKRGSRQIVKGYLRSDFFNDSTSPTIRVRAYIVTPDQSKDAIIQKQTLKSALSILKQSKDVESAISKIEKLLK